MYGVRIYKLYYTAMCVRIRYIPYIPNSHTFLTPLRTPKKNSHRCENWVYIIIVYYLRSRLSQLQHQTADPLLKLVLHPQSQSPEFLKSYLHLIHSSLLAFFYYIVASPRVNPRGLRETEHKK